MTVNTKEMLDAISDTNRELNCMELEELRAANHRLRYRWRERRRELGLPTDETPPSMLSEFYKE